MRDDGIKAIAISDDIIRREAVLRMLAISRKEDQKHDDISGSCSSSSSLLQLCGHATELLLHKT